MATSKKKSGLGADAIFGTEQPPTETTTPATKATSKPEPEPLRSTITLPADVVVLLSRLKEQAILEGNRQTNGEIIADGIRLLAEQRNIKAP